MPAESLTCIPQRGMNQERVIVKNIQKVALALAVAPRVAKALLYWVEPIRSAPRVLHDFRVRV